MRRGAGHAGSRSVNIVRRPRSTRRRSVPSCPCTMLDDVEAQAEAPRRTIGRAAAKRVRSSAGSRSGADRRSMVATFDRDVLPLPSSETSTAVPLLAERDGVGHEVRDRLRHRPDPSRRGYSPRTSNSIVSSGQTMRISSTDARDLPSSDGTREIGTLPGTARA